MLKRHEVREVDDESRMSRAERAQSSNDDLEIVRETWSECSSDSDSVCGEDVLAYLPGEDAMKKIGLVAVESRLSVILTNLQDFSVVL
jgi:hypothetical protein